jgi:mono/diheme cytochrome c family protein
VLLVTTLKRGSLYVLPLKGDGKAAAGPFWRYFQSENRFRDTAVSPDGKTIYIATDPGGLGEGLNGGAIRRMQDRGAILAFTYTGEGTGTAEEPKPVSGVKPSATEERPGIMANGAPAQFTAAQVNAGKTSYNANCAVCHGSTMTNGTFGTPLAGEYFKTNWSGRPLRAFYDRAVKTMPPAAPASLPRETYANIVAYILEVNGLKAGSSPLPPGGDAMDKMAIK